MNSKGSVLLIPVSIISIVGVALAAAYSANFSAVDNLEKSERIYQATNYASEWVEFAKAYMMTSVNNDRISWWEKKVRPLNGKYKISYDADTGYNVESIETTWPEVIEDVDPKYRRYDRIIEIRDGDSGTNEKKIVVSVDFGGSSPIQVTTSHTNVYGK